MRRAGALAAVFLAIFLAVKVFPSGAGAESAEKTTTATITPSRSLTVTAVGDIMMGTPAFGLPSSASALFASVTPLLAGDVVLGNLEGTLSTGGTSKCGPEPGPNCYAFQSPPDYAASLRAAGFTIVNLANNHSGDFGESGRTQTLTALAGARLPAAGVPEGRITYLRAAGGTAAVVGFGFNDGMNSINDIPGAQAIVHEAARYAGIVIVTMHNGAEGSDAQHLTFAPETFYGENRGDPVRFSRSMVDAGADLVVGHGPHVMRAMEVYQGRLIAYSMGNFVGYRAFNLAGPSGESGVLSVHLAVDGRLVGGRLTSVALVGDGVPTPGGTSVARVRDLTKQDLGSTGARLAADGTIGAAPSGG